MQSRTATYNIQNLHEKHTPPSRAPQSAHASTSRLRKRQSTGRPLTALSSSGDGPKTLRSKINQFENAGVRQQVSREFAPSIENGSFAFEFNGTENMAPTWLKRISTLSSLKSGSLEPSPRPGSPSITYSNGSSAPILPDAFGIRSTTSTRNKLVKRSTSQCALFGSSPLHSTLRRPATSHQRSATIQQFQQDDPPGRSSLATSSALHPEDTEPDNLYSGPPEVWQPFFISQAGDLGKDSHQRKRSANGLTAWSDTIKTVVPEATEVATLLMATSISQESPIENTNGRASNISGLSRPFTPLGMDYNPTSGTDTHRSHGKDDTPELKSRHSFSLSEMFPSPSPSTWKMPRTSSVRQHKTFTKAAASKRVVSAPQPHDSHDAIFIAKSSEDAPSKTYVARSLQLQDRPISQDPSPSDVHSRILSSPLPALSRLSAFEVDLPDTVPSYPSSPPSEHPASSPTELSPYSSYPRSSALGRLPSNPKSPRFSYVPSEPGSTLLGSDNDNSRLLSGDEDDIDSRSETVFDSTRTGATDNSHTGVRRPPIDTIFDESPPPELPSKRKLVDLQDMLLHDRSFLRPDRLDLTVADDEQENHTPGRANTPCKEKDSPTPMRETNETFHPPKLISSSPSAPSKDLPNKPLLESHHHNEDEELWSFEDTGISTANQVHIRKVSLSNGSSALLGTSQQAEPGVGPPKKFPLGGSDKLAKSNIFEWSEQSTIERDSTQGDSPRPKTVHGRNGKEMRGAHLNGRRGSSALHLRSQSVPVQKDMNNRRSYNNSSKLDSWILGNKGPSEDWDGDFEFEELPRAGRQAVNSNESMRASLSAGMLVPRDILERQASFHGQFGQVKELTLLVEELKRLQQQAAVLGIMEGQSAELWKEAEGIINLATLDDEEREIFPPRSPHSPSIEFDLSDEDSPSLRSRQRSVLSTPREDRSTDKEGALAPHVSSKLAQSSSGLATPPSSRPRKDSSAKAKSVLETIQRGHYDPSLLDAPFAQKKLPFDTTSLKDLVVRAGVVLRALKEIVRQANGPATPEQRPSNSGDPLYITQMFHHPHVSPTASKSPRITQSPKSSKSSMSPKSQRSSSFIGGSITGNDNDINAHIKMMTVV